MRLELAQSGPESCFGRYTFFSRGGNPTQSFSGQANLVRCACGISQEVCRRVRVKLTSAMLPICVPRGAAERCVKLASAMQLIFVPRDRAR
jgi:hypothetical protein